MGEAPATKPTEAENSLQASATEAEQIPFSADQNAVADRHGRCDDPLPHIEGPEKLEALVQLRDQDHSILPRSIELGPRHRG